MWTYVNKVCTLNVLLDDLECESFTLISTDSLILYENKYYLQWYLDNCAYNISTKQMRD